MCCCAVFFNHNCWDDDCLRFNFFGGCNYGDFHFFKDLKIGSLYYWVRPLDPGGVLVFGFIYIYHRSVDMPPLAPFLYFWKECKTIIIVVKRLFHPIVY